MQKQQGTQDGTGLAWPRSLSFSRKTVLILFVIISGSVLLSSSFALMRGSHAAPGMPSASKSKTSKTTVSNGTNLWVGDQKTTEPVFNLALSNNQPVSVSPSFASYYQSHNGLHNLGTPLTDAFPSTQGWMQFFALGALLLPTAQQQSANAAENSSRALSVPKGNTSSGGIVRLPLLQALLTNGSQVAVGGDGSPLTYVNLRTATDPDQMVLAPTDRSQGVFIKGGVRDGAAVGHLIPQTLWNYINRADISLDGWETDFGPPLTEAVSFSMTKQGKVHRMLVQAFWRDGVILDQDTLDSTGQPSIQRLDTGLACLRTFGPPTVNVSTQQSTWTQGNTTIFNAPATGSAVAHMGAHFPLKLLGDTTWKSGLLWYHVQWGTPKQMASGWVEAALITFTAPDKTPAWASMDALSPTLAAYLDSIDGNVDAVVYDVTHQRYYTYNETARFITGSSMKVPIMLTFLDMVERQGREPTEHEMDLLTTMIENSNNDSASDLYYGEIGGADGVAQYLQRINIPDLSPNPTAWGYSLITPLAMVNLLTDLYEGTILTAQHRALALSLMEQIEADQQVGVGDTAPQGVTVAMKDGWLPDDNNLWAMNSSGIVMQNRETYIISVYTHGQPDLDHGHAIVRHVCAAVAALLL